MKKQVSNASLKSLDENSHDQEGIDEEQKLDRSLQGRLIIHFAVF